MKIFFLKAAVIYCLRSAVSTTPKLCTCICLKGPTTKLTVKILSMQCESDSQLKKMGILSVFVVDFAGFGKQLKRVSLSLFMHHVILCFT